MRIVFETLKDINTKWSWERKMPVINEVLRKADEKEFPNHHRLKNAVNKAKRADPFSTTLEED